MQCAAYLSVVAAVVQGERGLRGLRKGAGLVQGLGVVELVVLHLWVELCELLIAVGSIAEVLDVVVAVTQQRQRCPGLEHIRPNNSGLQKESMIFIRTI